MMAPGIGVLAIVSIHGDPETLVLKFSVDPFLNLVRKLIGRGSSKNMRGAKKPMVMQRV